VYGLDAARWGAVLLTGSGTAAVEAMVASLVRRAGRLLVLENGVYGERLTAIALVHGIAVDRVSARWSDPLPLERVAAALEREPRPTHLAVVHHETTTGRLNALAALSALCAARGVGLLVDAVSSFGAEEIAFDAWAPVACAGSAAKCLHGVPGLSFVVVQRSALAEARLLPRTLSLDLVRHARAQDEGSTLFTPGVPAFHALAEALAEHAERGGWRARRARYEALASRIALRLALLGVESYLPAGQSSVVLRSYRLPAHIDYVELHAGLRKRGFVIYAGQGGLQDRLFRISTLGEISDADVLRLEQALGEILPTPRRSYE
jgi:2-aminoethylphosphonate-pyruvate transaminase